MVDEEAMDDEPKVEIITLSVADAETMLAEVRQKLTVSINWQHRLTRVRAGLAGRLAALPKRGRSIEQQHEAEDLTEALGQVVNGVGAAEGVSEHIRLKIAGKPGLDEVSAEIPRLKKDIRNLKRHLARWPNETVTHAYRYLGSDGVAYLNGSELEKGEVVNLTRGQASGMRDRFEAVEEQTTHAKAS